MPKRAPDAIKDEKGQATYLDISQFPIPDGTQHTPSDNVAFLHAVMSYSKNKQAAKEFLRWLHAKVYEG